MIAGVGVERVLAPNPGPFTGPGTNTYVIGGDQSVVILDPGPIDHGHADAVVAKVGSRTVESVIVTHTHSDHAPLANPLAADLGVPALGYAPGPDFEPDVMLADGELVHIAGEDLVVVHTPGHSHDHLCFRLGDTLFTGDHIMGGSSVMVEDMGPYLASLERLRGTGLRRLMPGHGEPMDEPEEVISWYLAHRMERERQIVDSMRRGSTSIGAIVEDVYRDVDTALHPLAARSVVAHLRKLDTDDIARREGDEWQSGVRLIGEGRRDAD